MAVYDQVARHAGYLDITVYAAAAIDVGLAVNWATVSGQALAVALPTNGGGSETFAGIVTTAIPAGGYGKICILGPCVALAHEAIAQGDMCQVYDVTSHLGQIFKMVKTGNQEALRVIGTAMTASTTDGDYFELLLVPSCTTTAA